MAVLRIWLAGSLRWVPVLSLSCKTSEILVSFFWAIWGAHTSFKLTVYSGRSTSFNDSKWLGHREQHFGGIRDGL